MMRHCLVGAGGWFCVLGAAGSTTESRLTGDRVNSSAATPALPFSLLTVGGGGDGLAAQALDKPLMVGTNF